MAHLLNLLATSASPSPAKSAVSGLNPLAVLLGVLTVILLILFVGFLLSGRRRGTEQGAAEPSSSPAPRPVDFDDGARPGERFIYHAQPRPFVAVGAAAEAPAEATPEATPVEPEASPGQPAPGGAPFAPAARPPLTAWARSPADAPVSPADARQPAPSPAAPPVKAPPFIFPSTQRAESRVPGMAAIDRVNAEPSAPSIVAPVAAPAVAPPPLAAAPAAPPAEVTPIQAEEPAANGQPPAVASVTAIPVEVAQAADRQEDALILLIEDDERIAKFYTILFQAKGYRVENAHDGVEGVDMAQALKPALILLDVMMPRMNGLMVLQVLRANPETATTPVVVLSNYMEPPLIQRALQLGAVEYVVKSQARPEQLVNALPSWLEGHPSIH